MTRDADPVRRAASREAAVVAAIEAPHGVDQEADLKDDSIDFDANNGVVTITGTVKSAAERDKVGDLARSQPGVKDVVNTLEVKPDNSRTNDSRTNDGTTKRK